MPLEEYRAKRNFDQTPEPTAQNAKPHRRPIFVIQEHHASHLHYDFRLEADGVLKSWAVPKQPSLDPAQKRLAVRVEDHPLAYASFAGTIPAGQYGAGTVAIWDHGTYENLRADTQSVTEGIAAGRLEFALHGERLQGRFTLIRMRGKGRGKENWLLIKSRDEHARSDTTAETPQAKPARSPRAKQVHVTRPKVSGERPAPADIEVTHPDKLLFPEAGITKGQVFDYYRRIAPRLLPYLHDRPVTLERLPEGLGSDKRSLFWQKNTPASYPAWIPRVELPNEEGKTVAYAVVNDAATLLYLVNQNAVTFHVWLSRTGSLDRPDFVLFDLDPGEASFADVVAVAKQLHVLLAEEDREAFVKTSGKSGLHVLVPWHAATDYDAARSWADGLAERLADTLPEQATREARKVQRGRRVFLDVTENARGRHVVPPYVLRATPGASVSMPLSWRELTTDVDPAAYNLRTVFRRLSRLKRDPLAALLAGVDQSREPKEARR
jgi:bifunctional non-homologous end joining protein LigD